MNAVVIGDVTATVVYGPQIIERVLAILPTSKDKAMSSVEISHVLNDVSYSYLIHVLENAVSNKVLNCDKGHRVSRVGKRYVCKVYWK